MLHCTAATHAYWDTGTIGTSANALIFAFPVMTSAAQMIYGC